MRISFVGGGTMGDAIIQAVLNNKVSKPSEVSASDIKEERRQYLKDKYGIDVTADNAGAVKAADVIVLAVKPQSLPEVMPTVKGKLKPEQLVLSIIAGARIQTLRNGLGHAQIVRSMPNTPAQIGDGMTVWTTTPEVTPQQKQWAQSILGVMGKEIFVDDEKYLDMATAVSGSGPAYVFLLAESMAAAAVKIGMPQSASEQMVTQTLVGAAHLLARSGKPPAELRRLVTSPGGTTAEAIATFDKGNFQGLVADAITAAYEKAKKLGS